MSYTMINNHSFVISHNVRGLNIPEKRISLLRELHKAKPAVVFLQETHFKTGNIPKLHDKQYTQVFHATNSISRSKGVSILLHKNSEIVISQQLTDTEGRYIFLKGNWAGTPITLANVYFPNSAQITFCQRVIDELKSFATDCIVFGGDFNLALNPLQDTSDGKSSVPYKKLRKIKTLLASLTLIDSWRTCNPTGKDFTYFSTLHNKFTRIDYIFISQRDLPLLKSAKIGIKTFSDHAPISMTLHKKARRPRTTNWRLNPSLLTDLADTNKISETIKYYFKENESEDIIPMNIWEAHKCVVRGEFIKLGAAKKREAEKELMALTQAIRDMETKHKQSLAIEAATTLLELRKKLQSILNLKAQRILFSRKGFFYEHGDKSGKFLAKALKETLLSTNILAIKTKQNQITNDTQKIAQRFQEYYTDLYNLPSTHKPKDLIGSRK